MMRMVGKVSVMLVFGTVCMLGCKSNPVTPPAQSSLPDTTGRDAVFTEGFEGDLSSWAINYLLTTAEPRVPRMRISTAAAHEGTHAITTDSNWTALMLNIDSTASFPKMKVIESGVAGVEFYFMAQSAGGINFTIELGQNAGSSGGLGYAYGIGFDTSNKLKCTYSDLYNDDRKDSLYTLLVPGKWYKGTVEISFTAKTVNYFLDGKQIRTMPLQVADLKRLDGVLLFRGVGAEGAMSYFADDFKLYTK
jgi:hypothetical protein